MVATNQVQIPKNTDKIPASKVSEKAKATVSPSATKDDVQALRVRNQILTESLAAIKETASKELKKSFDLVWFAKYRYRYPNHEASQRIDEEYKEEIEKLRGDDGDFHHGFNSGVLAAVRMFKEKADILHVNDFEELSADLMAEAVKHTKKIEAARKQYPHTEVESNTFPTHS